ncbi:MAG TPA: non-homologous end-joining DNA ligase [Egibacteraceae bacterium]|nr:non-homologous end-joining DNA ligase [Egibacteraceae bacterium]
MSAVPTTIAFPQPLPAVRRGGEWWCSVDGVEVRVRNLDKLFWAPEGYTKADLLAYYFNIADWILPHLRGRPLTLKRMPDGADGEFFYEKHAPNHTPDWVATAEVTSRDDGKTIDYLLAEDRPTLVWLANLGCIEMHSWHSPVQRIGTADYAFFDLDPFDVPFATVREVALLIRAVLDELGLRGYARTSGATGMQVHVPLDPVHPYRQVTEWVERVCRLINRADPERTTMQWQVSKRSGQVFLDHNMNTEGKSIVVTYSARPERAAPVATPLTWDEVAGGAEPQDFTISTVFSRLERVGDLYAPVLEGGQDLRAAMRAVGMDADEDSDPERTRSHDAAPARRRARAPGSEEGGARSARRSPSTQAAQPPPTTPAALSAYRGKRDFSLTPEPAGDDPPPPPADDGPRFVIQHHLATRLHHDLRLERDGTAPSWAIPKGLPDVPGVRRLAVRTEDHPLSYMSFSGDIPAGEYGAGPVRIWDSGTYELVEWTDDKVSFRLRGARHQGEFHLVRTGGEDGSQWIVLRSGDAQAGLPGPPPRISPMLAIDGGAPFDDPEWLFEIKWDGIRALATLTRPSGPEDGSTRLCTRNGNDVSAAYLELSGMWERILARNAVLDGEIVALDEAGRPSFQRLQQRMHVRDERALRRLREHSPVHYMAFDLLAVDGESLVGLPLRDRLARLDEVVVPGERLRRSEPVAADGIALFEAARSQGLEGLIAKRASSPYRPGRRSPEWRKLKVRKSALCVIGGWQSGEGGRAGRLGSLLLGAHDGEELRFVGKCGTGFDDAELRRLGEMLDERAASTSPFSRLTERLRPAPHWVAPTLVCAVEYSEVTDSGRLRAPSYKGLRPDVDPRECALGAIIGDLAASASSQAIDQED